MARKGQPYYQKVTYQKSFMGSSYHDGMSSELWTWERRGEQILTLKSRLGFSETICFLDYCIKDTGDVADNLNKKPVSNPEGLYWILTHYAEAEETPLTNELIPYDKLPGGYAFFGAFRQLAVNPLLEAFGESVEDFVRCCLHFGGEPCSFGDTSFQIPALPYIPITVVLWEKTEEFPPRCLVYYDTSASHYLPTEDLAHLGELLSVRLIEAKDKV